MISVFLQSSGGQVAVGIEGKKQEIVRELFSFQVHDAAPSGYFLSDHFLYFWSTYDELVTAYAHKLASQAYQETGIEFESDSVNLKFIKIARKIVSNLPRRQFLESAQPSEEYSINPQRSQKHECF